MLKDPYIWQARRNLVAHRRLLAEDLEQVPENAPEYPTIREEYEEVNALLHSLQSGSRAQQFKAADKALEL